MEKKVKMIGETEIEDITQNIIEDAEWKEV
jgi:hypothetical protein